MNRRRLLSLLPMSLIGWPLLLRGEASGPLPLKGFTPLELACERTIQACKKIQEQLNLSITTIMEKINASVEPSGVRWVEATCEARRIGFTSDGVPKMRRRPNTKQEPHPIHGLWPPKHFIDRNVSDYSKGIPCNTRFRYLKGTVVKCPECGTVQEYLEPQEGIRV
jgi:hypothetical protein